MEADSNNKKVNILILGETGVGKSTFINAFINYMLYGNLREAEMAQELTFVVPTKFTITDDNFEEKTVFVGDDKNECDLVGASATQCTKHYVFPVKNSSTQVCLIDTPGIGDTRGLDQDNINLENILDYINNFEELHAICILLKPNNARLTALFETCIKQLLSRLEKSASDNIIFIFTNSRCTFYRPGDTMPALRNILDEIRNSPPYVQIPLNKYNVFCLDNEAFRFLVCIKNAVTFTDEEKEQFATSWKNSSKVCEDLIRYVRGDVNGLPLEAHKIKNTISINRARNIIFELTQPIGEIMQIIIDNLSTIKRHKNSLHQGKKDLNTIKEKLHVPVTNLEVYDLPEPRTVCTAPKCCQIYEVFGKKKYNYITICHDPCYLKNAPKDVVGSPELSDCAAFHISTHKCHKCGCDYSKHMHIYYGTHVVVDQMIDENTLSHITTKESALQELHNLTENLDLKTKQWKEERLSVINICAVFAHFLQTNSITPYRDVFEAYIEHLIDRENSLGQYCDKDMTQQLQTSLRQYKEEKFLLQKHSIEITAEDVFHNIALLYGLPLTGEKIEEMVNKRSKTHQSESNQNALLVNLKGIQRPDKNDEKMITEEISTASGHENEKMLVDDNIEKQENDKMEICDETKITYSSVLQSNINEAKLCAEKPVAVHDNKKQDENKQPEKQPQSKIESNRQGRGDKYSNVKAKVDSFRNGNQRTNQKTPKGDVGDIKKWNPKRSDAKNNKKKKQNEKPSI